MSESMIIFIQTIFKIFIFLFLKFETIKKLFNKILNIFIIFLVINKQIFFFVINFFIFKKKNIVN